MRSWDTSASRSACCDVSCKNYNKKNLINKNRADTNRAPPEPGQGARFVDLLMTRVDRLVNHREDCARFIEQWLHSSLALC